MANDKLTDRLRAGEIILGDGAMGTMLQAAGLTDGGAPELWNVNRPEVVQGVHRGYVEAGSQIIQTNTFGGNLARLNFHGVGDQVYTLNRAGAELACAVAHNAGVLVAGSVGPTGDLIEPVGALSIENAQAMFAEQVRGLLDGGVDFVLIETMSHLNEVDAAIRGARSARANVSVAVTMSFDTNYHTMMGVSPREALEFLAEVGIEVVGANCGNGPDEIETVMTQMAQYRPSQVWLMAQSNAGLPKYVDGEIHYDGTPEVMADYSRAMRNLGVDVIGACCGSTPKHVAAMGSALLAAKNEPVAGPPRPAESKDMIETPESRSLRSAERRRGRRQNVS